MTASEQVDVERLRAQLDAADREPDHRESAMLYGLAMSYVRRALDELLALREAARWRPIDSFQLDDGSACLLLIDGSPYMGSRWGGEFFIDGPNFNESFTPTHWQPLPAPPTTEAGR